MIQRVYIAPRPYEGEGPGQFLYALAKKMRNRGIQTVNRLDDRPDLVLVPSTAPAGFLTAVSSRGIPIVQRLDGVCFDLNDDFAQQNRSLRRVLEQASVVIFQSEFSKEMAFRYVGNPSCYRIVYNASDPDIFHSTGNVYRPPFHRVLMAASRWRPHKRLKDILTAFEYLRDGKTCLLVVGSTKNISLSCRPAADMIFLGDVRQEELAMWMRGADVFVHPSWRDWCPNVVLQAMASGLAVVCSSLGGTREIVGEAGLLVQSDEKEEFKPLPLYDESKISRLDPQKLANSIQEAFIRRDELKTLALRRTSDVLSMERAVDEYIQVFNMAINRETILSDT